VVDFGALADATETALIVPVPAADAVVGTHRRALDHSAVWGVPPHITVVYPFLAPDQVTEAVVDEVRTVLTGVESFECTFSRVAWFRQDVVWLSPEPAEPLRTLTELVWRRFPECPPYGGAFADVIPHLTVGSTRLGDLAALKRAAVDVQTKLPISTTIDRVCLMAGTATAGSWRTVVDFGLAVTRLRAKS
jgi:2'-5' RNA ligase